MSVNSNHKAENTRDFTQVQVINRAATILRALRDLGGMNLSQLARTVGLARTTVYRIVATLESEGLITTAPNGQIQLGIELISLGAAVHTDIRRELRPYLEELSLQVDETVDLAILDNNKILFLDQVTRLQRLHAVSSVGVKFPLHCTANGKALLASLPNETVLKIIPEKLEACTPNTLQTRDQLLKELETIRATGVAYDREEHTLGICAVGSVVNAPMDTLAAITIPVPSVRFYDNEERLVSALLQTSHAISSRYKTA